MDRKQEITEDRAVLLNERINILIENAADRPEISVEYFVLDDNKDGGAYVTVQGNFKRIDEYTRDIILADGTVIPAENVFNVEGEIFHNKNCS